MKSAGLLIYRLRGGIVEVFLVHPGVPFWANKDVGAWSIPKGEFTSEDPLEAAKREFHEETGLTLEGDFRSLQPVKQPSGKTIYAWAVEGDCDPTCVRSNAFSMEWPRGSGKQEKFPEVDIAEWFELEKAREKILKG